MALPKYSPASQEPLRYLRRQNRSRADLPAWKEVNPVLKNVIPTEGCRGASVLRHPIAGVGGPLAG